MPPWRSFISVDGSSCRLRRRASALLVFLTNLVNAILIASQLPDKLSAAELVYFYKMKGDPLELCNYRGIALQSVLYKIAAAHTASRLQTASDSLGLLHPAQGACRKGSHAGLQLRLRATARLR